MKKREKYSRTDASKFQWCGSEGNPRQFLAGPLFRTPFQSTSCLHSPVTSPARENCLIERWIRWRKERHCSPPFPPRGNHYLQIEGPLPLNKKSLRIEFIQKVIFSKKPYTHSLPCFRNCQTNVCVCVCLRFQSYHKSNLSTLG